MVTRGQLQRVKAVARRDVGAGELADGGSDEHPPHFQYKNYPRFVTTLRAIINRRDNLEHDFYTFSGVNPATFLELNRKLRGTSRPPIPSFCYRWSSYSANSEILVAKVSPSNDLHDLLEGDLWQMYIFYSNDMRRKGWRHLGPFKVFDITDVSSSSSATIRPGSGSRGGGVTVSVGAGVGGKGANWNIINGGAGRRDTSNTSIEEMMRMPIRKYMRSDWVGGPVPKRLRKRRFALPTLVLESGYIESMGFLRHLMTEWLSLDGGGEDKGIKIVLLVMWDGKGKDKGILIERWEEEDEEEEEEVEVEGQAELEVGVKRKRPVLRQWLRIMRKESGGPNPANGSDVSGAPAARGTGGLPDEDDFVVTGNHGVDLILPFEKMFLRKPKVYLKEWDLELAAADLRRYAQSCGDLF